MKILNKFTKNSVQNHTVGMFIIGGVVWILYLVWANTITYYFNVHHLIPEITGVPASWIVNYWLNTKLNFDMPFTWKRFISFCGISVIGWGIYLLTTIICTDVIHLASIIGTIIGVFTKTIYNVVFQQAITFGKFGDKKEIREPKSASADYDWNSYYNGNFIQKWWKHRISDEILSMIGENPVIDVGCGSSPTLSMVKHPQKVGVDLNANKIAFLKEHDKSSIYFQCDANNIPFKDGTQSTVICSEIIEHCPRPNELVKELARICKPNGIVILATPDYASIYWNIIEIIYGLLMRVGYELEHGSKFTKTGIVSLCNAYGLELEDYKVVAKSDMVLKFRKRASY